jgi:hypothetical protein
MRKLINRLLHHTHVFDSKHGIEVVPQLGFTWLKCRCGQEKIFYMGGKK